jgi:hypothetical protein
MRTYNCRFSRDMSLQMVLSCRSTGFSSFCRRALFSRTYHFFGDEAWATAGDKPADAIKSDSLLSQRVIGKWTLKSTFSACLSSASQLLLHSSRATNRGVAREAKLSAPLPLMGIDRKRLARNSQLPRFAPHRPRCNSFDVLIIALLRLPSL